MNAEWNGGRVKTFMPMQNRDMWREEGEKRHKKSNACCQPETVIKYQLMCTALHPACDCAVCVFLAHFFYVGSAVFDDALKLHAVAGDRCHV